MAKVSYRNTAGGLRGRLTPSEQDSGEKLLKSLFADYAAKSDPLLSEALELGAVLTPYGKSLEVTKPDPKPVLVGISHSFHNKIYRGDKQRAFTHFSPVLMSLDELAAHIAGGGAWTPAAFQYSRRNRRNFASSGLLALDFDGGVSVASALENPLIRQCAAIVYPTASSTPDTPKTRVIFALSEPIYSRSEWEDLQARLLAHFANLNPDMHCSDAARLYYGSTQPGAGVRSHLRLPVETVRALQPTMTPAAPQAEAHSQPASKSKAAPRLCPVEFVVTAIRCDRGLAYLAYGLDMTSRLQIWLVLDELSREGNGQQKIADSTLFAAVERFGIQMCRKTLKATLRRGSGVFWNYTAGYISRSGYGYQAVVLKLLELAARCGLEKLLHVAKPGHGKRVHLDVSGKAADVEARILELYVIQNQKKDGWPVANVSLAETFNRDIRVIRQTKQRSRIVSTPSIVQYPRKYAAAAPEHRITYTVHFDDGRYETRYKAQGVNVLFVPAAAHPSRHDRRGQQRRMAHIAQEFKVYLAGVYSGATGENNLTRQFPSHRAAARDVLLTADKSLSRKVTLAALNGVIVREQSNDAFQRTAAGETPVSYVVYGRNAA